MDVNDRKARAAEEAAQWWQRLGTLPPEKIDEKDRQEFTQWLRESPLHVAELLHISHVHDALGRFNLWREIPLEAPGSDETVVALVPGVARRQGRRGWITAALAISIVAIGLFLGLRAMRGGANLITTDRAERREVVLKDGSIVNLEPETAVRIYIDARERYLTLTRGRAVFHVAKDPSRPFIVHSGQTDVRAVGTVFGVDHTTQNTVVTVSEGKVAVVPVTPMGISFARQSDREAKSSPSEMSGARGRQGHSVFLIADQQLTVQNSGALGAVQNVDSTRALAWSQGRLVFDSAPLEEVVREFNRYNRVQLRLQGDDLAHRTISGVFKATDPQTLIDFIAAGAHVVIKHQDNEDVVIASDASADR